MHSFASQGYSRPFSSPVLPACRKSLTLSPRSYSLPPRFDVRVGNISGLTVSVPAFATRGTIAPWRESEKTAHARDRHLTVSKSTQEDMNLRADLMIQKSRRVSGEIVNDDISRGGFSSHLTTTPSTYRSLKISDVFFCRSSAALPRSFLPPIDESLLSKQHTGFMPRYTSVTCVVSRNYAKGVHNTTPPPLGRLKHDIPIKISFAIRVPLMPLHATSRATALSWKIVEPEIYTLYDTSGTESRGEKAVFMPPANMIITASNSHDTSEVDRTSADDKSCRRITERGAIRYDYQYWRHHIEMFNIIMFHLLANCPANVALGPSWCCSAALWASCTSCGTNRCAFGPILPQGYRSGSTSCSSPFFRLIVRYRRGETVRERDTKQIVPASDSGDVMLVLILRPVCGQASVSATHNEATP